ncbi:Bifunctional solanapyrone synthase [Talaromyces islandicus]|uniref:Bifunctional solanapyrone synthase n=1 Tax=Talaromyces islandicus TaxID=28573 RepID=A0A0U1MAW8_TALIS|nr:Bifunctional solanapyrone synthase [Talaromyces islandicus]
MLLRWILPCLAASVPIAGATSVAAQLDSVLSRLVKNESVANTKRGVEKDTQDDAASLQALLQDNWSAIDQLGQESIPAIASCAISKILFRHGYVDAKTGNYTASEEVNWSTGCWEPAACFVSPETTLQTALLLAIIKVTGSKFSIRSHGHLPNPGFASIDDSGVLIDLRKLSDVSVSDDKSIVSAGAGSTWGDVYDAVDPLGLYAVGTRYLGVGVGGSILGGGIPIIPSLYGLACDNVKNFEVVLGDLTVVNANENEHPDLYKALKGGGSNFGIVTRFDVYTVPLHNIWYKTISLPATAYKQILAAIVDTQNRMEDDSKSGIIIQAAFGVFQITYLYADHVGATPAAFQPIDNLLTKLNGTVSVPATNTTALSFSASVSAPEADGYREAAGVSSLVDLDLYTKVYEYFDTAQYYSNSTGTGMALVIQQYGKAAVEAGNLHGGNLFNLSPVAQNWWDLLVEWANPADGAASHEALFGLVDYINEQSKQAGKFLPYVFPNTADGSQDVMGSYGQDSLARLRAASKKYDPDQVFQTLQNDGWLVNKA